MATGSVIDRYEYPLQEMEIRRGADLKHRDGSSFGTVEAVDRALRIVDVKKGPSQADNHPASVFSFTYISPDAMEDALATIGAVVSSANGVTGANGVAQALLVPNAPVLNGEPFLSPVDSEAANYAISIAGRLDHTVLAIQGPPGSGKTYTGARMICALVAAGKKVGVLGPSHKVVCNLLGEVGKAALEKGIAVRMAQKVGKHEDDLPSSVAAMKTTAAVVTALSAGAVDVVGGTAWLWSCPELGNAVDVLFVDEAGQVPLANALACSNSADSMVLLGDPQQLEQPRKGTHPEGV